VPRDPYRGGGTGIGSGPAGGGPGSGCGPGSGVGAGPGWGTLLSMRFAMFAEYPTRRSGNAVSAGGTGYHRAAMVTAPPAAGPQALHPMGTVRARDDGWFERALADAIAGGARDLEIDLRHVEFMDGSGVRAIAAAAERLRNAGRRLIVRAPAYVIEVALAEVAPPGSVTIYRV
jgi:anti-anti-sigma regulatory factor